MKHLSDDQLIEQAFGERDGEAAVEEHLAVCAECADSYAGLRSDLEAMKSMRTPERDERYGEWVWQSIAPSLEAYTGRKRGWWERGWLTVSLWKGLGYAAACALLAVGAFVAGRRFEDWKQGQAAAGVTHRVPQTKQPVVIVVLDDHLDRSERFLVQLKHADLDSATMASPIRDEARSLLAANKVCREKAAETSDPELTTALDHLDRLLHEAANEPGGLNARSIAKLQDEMNSDGLLFEVRVLRSRVANRRATGNDLIKGGTI
jgi:hypothetical protein